MHVRTLVGLRIRPSSEPLAPGAVRAAQSRATCASDSRWQVNGKEQMVVREARDLVEFLKTREDRVTAPEADLRHFEAQQGALLDRLGRAFAVRNGSQVNSLLREIAPVHAACAFRAEVVAAIRLHAVGVPTARLRELRLKFPELLGPDQEIGRV
jgi:hypothetical protein